MNSKIHILFSTSALGALTHVLREAGHRDQAICLWDDLSYGDISSIEPEDRTRALETARFNEIIDPASPARFWKRCAETRRNRVLWVAPQSPAEMSGFLAYMHRFGHIPCELISMDEVADVVRLKNGEPWGPLSSTGILSPENISAVIGRARPFSADEAASAARLWKQLVEENAMLRVPGGQGLISTAETFLDEQIITECAREWMPTISLLSEVMGRLIDNGGPTLSCVFVTWRIERLVAQGVLETRGNDEKPTLRFRGWDLIRRGSVMLG